MCCYRCVLDGVPLSISFSLDLFTFFVWCARRTISSLEEDPRYPVILENTVSVTFVILGTHKTGLSARRTRNPPRTPSRSAPRPRRAPRPHKTTEEEKKEWVGVFREVNV
jgi:hypothetical protein